MTRPAIACLLAAMTAQASGASVAANPTRFARDIAPILVKKCLGCHNAKKAEGGLDMTTFALLKKGGEKGGELILEPGAPDDSLLIEVVRPGGAPRMPYKLPALAGDEVATLERWVAEGAAFDGPSESETAIASLVDPLANLPRIALAAPVADPVTSVAFSPDGATLAASSGRTVLLFDARDGKALATLGDHPGPVTTVRFTADGATLIAAGGRAGMFGAITSWDLGTKVKRYEVRGHRDAILAAEIDPGAAILATAGYDQVVTLRDLATGVEVRTLKDHTDAVYALAFSPDGRRLASAGADRTVKLWDVATGRRLRTLSDATAELYALVFSPDGETVLAGGVDRSIRAWRVTEKEGELLRSVFAHDAAILRLAVSRDGKSLVSSGEDRDVKVWDLETLRARTALNEQADWPQGLAIGPDGSRIAVGRADGSLSVYETATGKVALTLRTAPTAAPAAKPELARNATLAVPSPRGATRGGKVRVMLSGNGVGAATAVILPEPGLSATIVPIPKGKPNQLSVDITIAPDARVGLHRIGVITPVGIPPFQSFAVAADPEAAEGEPNDDPSAPKTRALPATLVGAIEKPGDVDHFRFQVKRGDRLVFETMARPLGSTLLGTLTLLDEEGRVLGESSNGETNLDPILTAEAPRDGIVTLRVADRDYGGSANHLYRIAAGMLPYVSSVFPLGAGRGGTASIEVSGLNLGESSHVSLPVPDAAVAGSFLDVPLDPPGHRTPINRRRIVIADGPQGVEAEPNDAAKVAGSVEVPGGVSGRIGQDGDLDHFRFAARKGERLIVEVFGRRLGTDIDPAIEILDARGKPVPRAMLRPVAETVVAFRDHDSTKPGVRLTQWTNLAMNDYVLFGRELARIQALPRNPDDDCQFWSDQAQRLGWLETTPEHHPMGQPMYKVELHSPGATFPAGGVPPVTLTYRNDDGGPGFNKDARLTFDPPADGPYVVRVEDVRGLGGADSGYHLVVRRPWPDFVATLSSENPNIPRGGTTLLTVNLERRDGFDSPVEVIAEGLPPGITATPAMVEPGATSAPLALSADATAPAFSPPTWTVNARDTATGTIRHTIDPGGPRGGWVTVTPAANLAIEAVPGRVAIRPGQRVALTLRVARGPAFAGRVPIEVRNLPFGVRVLDIGLNGVLVTEKQSERTVFLFAEPWVTPTERPFYAVGKAEAAATEHSTPPINLVVGPRAAHASMPATSTAAKIDHP